MNKKELIGKKGLMARLDDLENKLDEIKNLIISKGDKDE